MEGNRKYIPGETHFYAKVNKNGDLFMSRNWAKPRYCIQLPTIN